jgi:excisionase family DNA binding protein
MTPTEVTVINPSYWADKGLQLARLLGSGPAGPIPDPTGKAPDPERMLIISDPGYWSASLRELQEVLNLAAVDDGLSPTAGHGGGLSAGATGASVERLTLTVEEAATVLGISRAFAYESVRRGDLPHVKIGRRLLIPRAALTRLLDSAMPAENQDPDVS